jgi:hypothetical protein
MAATKDQQVLCDLFGSSEIESVLREFAETVPDPKDFQIGRAHV